MIDDNILSVSFFWGGGGNIYWLEYIFIYSNLLELVLKSGNLGKIKPMHQQ